MTRPIAHRFKLEIAGQVKHGLMFDSEAALEQWLCDRGAVVAETAQPEPSDAQGVADGGPGRPSFESQVNDALASMPLADFVGCTGRVDVAERVQAKMGGSGPSTKTILRHLGQRADEILISVTTDKTLGQK